MRVYKKLFSKICNLENLLLAWEEFKVGKGGKPDVLEFEEKLEQNIFQLQRDLLSQKYQHGPYADFYIYDPKKRHIHKATVRDRVLHHAVYNILDPIFEPTFISHSFSCRIGKGNHKGVLAAEGIIRKVSRNYTRSCYILKCDVKKFFDSIDHAILLQILRKKIKDPDTLWLLEEIIGSFASRYSDLFTKKGLPIGNLTSQLFANAYMNEFDQFMKKNLRVEHYARYTDDFLVISGDRKYLDQLTEKIQNFLKTKLQLSLHPDKVEIFKCHQGIDFLGYVMFPHHRLVRKRTIKRMYRKLREKVVMYNQGLISEEKLTASLNSYLGILSHANAKKLGEDLMNKYFFWLNG